MTLPDPALCLNDILQLLLGFRQRRFRLVDVFHLDEEITRMPQALLDHLYLGKLSYAQTQSLQRSHIGLSLLSQSVTPVFLIRQTRLLLRNK